MISPFEKPNSRLEIPLRCARICWKPHRKDFESPSKLSSLPWLPNRVIRVEYTIRSRNNSTHPPKVRSRDFSNCLSQRVAVIAQMAHFVGFAVMCRSDFDFKTGNWACPPYSSEQESKERSRLIHFWKDDSRCINSGGSWKCGFQLRTSGGFGGSRLISISRSNGISLVPCRRAFAHRRVSIVCPQQALCLT